MFNLPVVYVYGSFPFDLDAIPSFSPYQFHFRFKMAAILKIPLNWAKLQFQVCLRSKAYLFFVILKTVSVPNFVLLTENEQFKHISAPLVVLQTKWCFWGSLKAKQLILVSKIILTDPYVTSRDLHGRKSYKFGLQVSSSRLCSTRALGSNQRNQRFT